MKRFLFFLVLTSALVGPPRCYLRAESKPAAETRDAAAEDHLPKIVPYLDSIPSPADGQGNATLTSSEPVPAGSTKDFEITFTVGDRGIAPGGFVLLQISPWWGWSQPQNLDPESEGYTEVRVSFSDQSLEVIPLSLNRLLVFSPGQRIKPGEKITFRYLHARVDRFAEAEELFQFFVDSDGDGNSAAIASPPRIRILPHPAARLRVNAPSQVEPGKIVKIHAAALDVLGDWSEFPPGAYELKVSRLPDSASGSLAFFTKADIPPPLPSVGQATPPSPPAKSENRLAGSIRAAGGEKILSFEFTPEEEGIYFLGIRGPSGLAGRSDVLLCQKGIPTMHLYFGDLHGHCRLSDGTGTPEDYYRYARQVSGLEIAALTDHSDYGTIPVKGPVWERIQKAAHDAYAPGEFVTFVGFEWTSWIFGHRNVYYRDGAGPVFRSIDPESDTPPKLWNLLAPYEAMTVAHHVGGGPVPADWSIPPGQKEWLVEIASVHGSSEYCGCEKCIYHPVQGAFVRDALALGYKLGIIGGGDTHDGHPGQKSAGALVTGLMGVYSPELTREAVWEAFRRRQVYATSGPKIILNFQVTGSTMGSETVWAAARGPVPLACRAIGCDALDRVEIIRNGKVIFQEPGVGFVLLFLAEDPAPPAGTSWYYAKVIQKDGNMAWSSPVWVTMK